MSLKNTILEDQSQNPFFFQANRISFLKSLEFQQKQVQEADNLSKQNSNSKIIQQDQPLKHNNDFIYGKQQNKIGLIKRLEKEGDELANYREEVLNQDEQYTQKRKQRAQSMKLWEGKDFSRLNQTYKIKNIVKEKKESNTDFIQKKREIFLSNLNISNKKDETRKLKEFIESEKSNLLQRIQYFKNDEDLVKKFKQDVEKQMEKAKYDAEQEDKKYKQLKILQSQRQNERDQLSAKIYVLDDRLKQLEEYKKFIQNIKEKYKGSLTEISDERLKEIFQQNYKQSAQDEEQDDQFITQLPSGNLAEIEKKKKQRIIEQYEKFKNLRLQNIPFESHELIKIKDRNESKNLFYIQQKNERVDILSQAKREKAQIQAELENNKKDINQRLQHLEKYKKELSEKRDKLKKQQQEFEQIVNQKVSDDNPDNQEKINYFEIQQYIKEIYSQLQSRNSEIDKDLYNPRDQMFAIETQMNNLFRTKNELQDQTLYKGAEQQVKQEENKANKQAQKIQEKQRIEEKALEREKKRERAIQEKRTGRTIVKKVILQKKEKQVEQVQEDNDDKYLDENYYI